MALLGEREVSALERHVSEVRRDAGDHHRVRRGLFEDGRRPTVGFVGPAEVAPLFANDTEAVPHGRGGDAVRVAREDDLERAALVNLRAREVALAPRDLAEIVVAGLGDLAGGREARGDREGAPDSPPCLVEVLATRRKPSGDQEDAGMREGPGRTLLDHLKRVPDELFAFLLLPLEVAEEEAEPGERQGLRRPARIRPRADRENLAERLLGALAVLEGDERAGLGAQDEGAEPVVLDAGAARLASRLPFDLRVRVAGLGRMSGGALERLPERHLGSRLRAASSAATLRRRAARRPSSRSA